MIESWEKHTAAIEAFREKLEELSMALPDSARNLKLRQQVGRAWSALSKTHNAMDQFISPVKSVPVKAPWDAPEFMEAWHFWKEYLHEQHGFIMKSRMEVKALKHLVEISGNSPQEAIRSIDYACAGGYKGLFKIADEPVKAPFMASLENNQQNKNGRPSELQKIEIPKLEIPDDYDLQ